MIAHDRDRAAAERSAMRSWLRWLPRGFAAGIVLTMLLLAATHPLLESRARQALAFGTLMSACVLDWSRWREFPWWGYAVSVAVFFGLAFAVWYLMPQ